MISQIREKPYTANERNKLEINLLDLKISSEWLEKEFKDKVSVIC